MERVWKKIGELRDQYELLREDRTPIDVFTFFEVDLGLDPIPFDNLTAKYRVEAALNDLQHVHDRGGIDTLALLEGLLHQHEAVGAEKPADHRQPVRVRQHALVR